MTIEDVQAKAFNILAYPAPPKRPPGRDSAIYKYWLANRDVGLPMTAEIPLDDGTTAMILSTGNVLHWTGGDDVAVV